LELAPEPRLLPSRVSQRTTTPALIQTADLTPPVSAGEASSCQTVVRSAAEIASATERSGNMRLAAPLESLGDAYPILRDLWERVLPDGTLTVVYGVGDDFRLARADVENLLRLAGFAPVTSYKSTSGREIVARRVDRSTQALSCTVVVPCRNEVDNVANLVARVPSMGTHTELLFVDGSSSDGTPERVEQLIQEQPERDIKLVRQDGKGTHGVGKAGATFQGFASASGDVVMILDADMTVRPEDLPRFYFALAECVAGFANGTRMIYPMEPGAMPGLNNIGNRVFSRYLSWLIGARITDTLCGTKAILRRDIPELLRVRPVFGGHDPWGDFDLLLGAACIGLQVVDVPVQYVAREAGESKMKPLAHGSALAQTCLVGARRLKLGKRPPVHGGA
jgi:Glycosyl transferase family 2